MEIHIGIGQNDENSPASAEDTNGVLMAEKSHPMVDSLKPPASAVVRTRKNKELPQDQVAILNNALMRIEEYFAPIVIQKVNHGNNGRVVLLLPEGLTLCPSCTRVRMPEQLKEDGVCHYCHESEIRGEL